MRLRYDTVLHVDNEKCGVGPALKRCHESPFLRKVIDAPLTSKWAAFFYVTPSSRWVR
jgi:hypothetical protein